MLGRLFAPKYPVGKNLKGLCLISREKPIRLNNFIWYLRDYKVDTDSNYRIAEDIVHNKK